MTKKYYLSTHQDLHLKNKRNIWLLLNDCFWSKEIPIEYVERFIRFSLCFGAFNKNDELIGFGRVITDYTTYAYICDVVVNLNYRQQGVCTNLLENMLSHPDLQGLKTWSLISTNDSKKIYIQHGFKKCSPHSMHLEINNLDIYTNSDFINRFKR